MDKLIEMNKLKLELENCYGIPSLKSELNFEKGRAISIYSPNGTMKTSLAQTFSDLSAGKESKDIIFPNRTTIRNILIDDNTLEPDSVFVVEPYSETFKSDKVSTLLVNADLKSEYDEILSEIEEKKDVLLKSLAKLSGLKKGCEETFSKDVTHEPNHFFKAIRRVKSDIEDCKDTNFSDLQYSKIFSDKILAFLNTKDFKNGVTRYIEKYDDLVGKSKYFKKGVFNHNNAATIAKSLKDNGFFDAQHTLLMSTDENISTEAELVEIIESEKQQILQDPELEKAFEEIDAKLKANAELRGFRDYLLANMIILPELSNISSFKDKIWISYLKTNEEAYLELHNAYSKGREQIEGIVESAKEEITDWFEVIREFNRRFAVPFKVSAENQEDVILKRDTLNVRFDFVDGRGSTNIDEGALFERLSQGERRALYLLNIIFEIKARKKAGIKTILVIDDIADSFDYKNKYAIVEYLSEIKNEQLFKQVILTHNYDFYRTVSSRLGIDRSQRLNALKNESEINLIAEKYQNNPFLYWKKINFSQPATLIASIAFIRNIAEYTGNDTQYLNLTEYLHIKSSTKALRVSDLKNCFTEILSDKDNLSFENEEQLVLDLIFSLADEEAQKNDDNLDLEFKICLAMAARLRAEIYMIQKLNDASFVDDINSSQTYELYQECISRDILNYEDRKILENVNLMTPENIHVNSFMYEPLLDMSASNLRNLYKEVAALQPS